MPAAPPPLGAREAVGQIAGVVCHGCQRNAAAGFFRSGGRGGCGRFRRIRPRRFRHILAEACYSKWNSRAARARFPPMTTYPGGASVDAAYLLTDRGQDARKAYVEDRFSGEVV